MNMSINFYVLDCSYLYKLLSISKNIADRGEYRLMDLKQMIGARIKEIRTKKGITQEQLSERMEINPKYLSSIERGKENPTLSTLIRLSESLGVDLSEIFRFIQIEDPAERKSLIISLLDESDNEQLKLIFKILSAIVY